MIRNMVLALNSCIRRPSNSQSMGSGVEDLQERKRGNTVFPCPGMFPSLFLLFETTGQPLPCQGKKTGCPCILSCFAHSA